MRPALLLVATLAACSEPPDGGPTLVAATPDHGPLVGGSLITLTGTSFDRGTRVLVGGREAPFAYARTSTAVEVVVPPGDEPGDAELVVLGEHGTAIAENLFAYSAPPTISSVSPASILYSAGTAPVSLTGTGFSDEDAGEVTVLLDGVPASEVTVVSDTELTFIAPVGPAFVRPTLELVNQRGSAQKTRAFRYAPGPRGGLVMFSRFGGSFATFFDPVDGTSFSIPRLPAANLAFTTVVLDERGDYWGFDRSQRMGRIDFRTQTIIDPVQIEPRFPALVRVGHTYAGVERISRAFGMFDPITRSFTPVGTAVIPCCGSYGLASDGTRVWFAARNGSAINLTPIDLATGETGTPVPIVNGSGLHFEELRYFGNTLYATSTDETLRAIDPVTGATTIMPVAPGRSNAMEVVE